jgi:hypothetical protein
MGVHHHRRDAAGARRHDSGGSLFSTILKLFLSFRRKRGGKILFF